MLLAQGKQQSWEEVEKIAGRKPMKTWQKAIYLSLRIFKITLDNRFHFHIFASNLNNSR